MTVKSRLLQSAARPETLLDADTPFYLRGDDFSFSRAVSGQPEVAIAPDDVDTPLEGPTVGGEIEAYLPSNPQNHDDGGTLELQGVSSITSADVGGFRYIFVSGGVDDGISVFRLNANGTLTPIADVTDGGTLELDGVRGLSTAMVDGNTYLFAAGSSDDGVSVFRVGTNGSLTAVHDVTDDATLELDGVADTASIRIGNNTYLYAAGEVDDGINIFRVAGDGRLTSLGQTVEGGALELDGVRALATVFVGATAYLIAGGGVDDGVSVFSINAATGALTSVNNVVDGAGNSLNGVSDIATAVVGGTTYVYVSGADDNGVTAYSMNGSGVLTQIDNEVDVAGTRIGGANSLSVTTIGGVQYLMVGGIEDGFSLYRIETGSNNSTAGTLTWVENVIDNASRELDGTNSVHGTTINGTGYIIGGGGDDNGVSSFGTTTTGQIWYTSEGNNADARLAYFNTDGFQHTSVMDNTPSIDIGSGFVESVAVDTAAGLYYILVTGNEGINARIFMGRIGSATPPAVVFTFDPTYAGVENNLAFGLEIDTINERLYVGYIEFNPTFGPTTQGIRQFNYNTTSGAVTGGAFFVTESTAGAVPPSTAGADGLFASRDLDIDTTHNVLYSQQLALGNGFETNNILRFSLSSPGAGTSLLNQAQFALDGDGSDFTTVNGIIADIEVDEDTDRLYFITRAEDVEEGGGEDSIWVLFNASTVANVSIGAGLVKLSLVGTADFPAATYLGANFYPTDMIMDEVNNILYVESENSNLVGGGTSDAILVFQLNAAGTQGTLINVIDMDFAGTANVEGLHFNYLADLGALTQTGTAAGEQAALGTDLLSVAPAISDFDGDHLASATVQITGGIFNSNENSLATDDLGYTSSMTQSGLIGGTNITVSWDQATCTLTLTGYDTFANYQAVLNSIHFRSSGDNPTNFGLNTFRTITWTISDGTPGVPGGAENSGTTTVNITAVNDAIVNNGISDRSTAEDTPLSITGLSITDPDLNPGITDITVTLVVTNGTLTLLTNVAGGLTAADIAGNTTNSVTVTATLNEINATLAAVNGLVFTNTPDFNGQAVLTITSNDGGNTGTGGASQDVDQITITITPVVDIANDSATTNEDTPVNVLVFANDTFEATDEAITGFTQGANGTVTLNDNGTAGDTTDDFLVYTANADFNGTDSFQYTVTSGGVTETATVNITINAVADIANDSATTNEDTPVNILVQANDTFENPVHSISAFGQGTNGTVTLNNNGTAGDTTDDFLVYTANADFNGTDSFTYTILSGGVTETATVNVTINAVADINDDNVSVAEDSGANNLNLLANDTFENAGRFISAVTQGAHGSVSINNNGTAGDATDDFVVYTVTDPNFNGLDSFTYTVTSGGVTETATVNVTLTAVNDPVTGTAPATLNLAEDATNVAVAGLSISDVDTVLAPAGVYEVTLAATNGTLTMSTLTGLTFTTGDGTGDATMTFHGTLADINAALATTSYTPTANFNGGATITLNVTDTFGGIVATGTGLATSDSDVVNVTVNAVNDTPVVAVQAAVASTEQVAGLIDPAATITDVELGALNNYAGSSLTVGRNGGPAAQDLLNFGASGLFTVNGANLEAGGLVFATYTGGNGSNLVITFTSSGTPATQALVNAVVQALQYTYTGDTPPASIVMDYTFNDGAPGNAGQGGGGSPTGTDAITINITDTPENAPPILDLDADDSTSVGAGYTTSFTEGGAAVLITDTDVLITDADSGAGDLIEGATIAINSPVAGDLLTLGAQPGFTVIGSGTATITITGTGTAAQYQAILAQITFTNTSDDPGASRTISITVTDGTDNSNIGLSTINITQINDEPTLTATGGTPTFTEGGALVDLFSAVSASTIEAGQTFSSLTLTVSNVTDGASELLRIDGSDVALTNGNVVATALNALIVSVTVTGSLATVTFSGAALSVSALQILVDGLGYRNSSENPTDANRVVTITQLVDSGSNGGADDNTTALNIAATVNVDPVNDAPVNSVPGTQTINEDASVTLSTANGNALSVSDADATVLTVTLTVAHGTLTLASTAGLSFGAGDGTNDLTMTFTGTAAAINAALGAGLTYNPNANFNGSDTIAVQTTDNGQSGGPTQTDNDSVTINITAINDAPVVIGDGTESATTINEDTPGAGQTIQALFAGQYSDAADNQIPNGGASSPGQFSGIAIVANGSSGATGQWQYFNGAIWVDIGPASQGAAVLLGDPFVTLLRFNPALNYNGPAPTLTAHLIDNSLGFGIVNGQVVNLSGPGATGGTTAYSTGTVVLSQDITAVNDAPVNGVPGTQTINEDASVTLSTGNGNAISVADVDATTLTVTLTVAHGTLTIASTLGLSFGTGDGTNDVTMTFSGTAAAINAALGAGLTYNPNANFNGSDTISVQTTDGGQTGTGGTQTDNDSVTVNITAINDAPVVIGDGTEQAADIDEDVPGPGQTIQALFSGQYSDAADNQIPNGGASSPGQFSGIAIVANGSSPATGQWQYFNGAIWVDIGPASQGAAVLLGNPFTTLLRFNPALDFYGNAPTLTVHLIDNSLGFGITNGQIVNLSGPGATGGTTAYSTGTVVLSQYVIPDNFPPEVDLNGAGAGIDYVTTFIEDGTAVSIGSGVTVFDADAIPLGDLIERATITLTDRVAGDLLTITGALPGFSISQTSTPTTFMIEIIGPGTGAQYAQMIQSIVYATTNQDPTVGGTDLARTVTVVVNDGDADSVVATTTINITPVDDLPVAAPDAFTINENGSIVGGNLFASNGSGADTDPDGPPLSISAVNGSAGNVNNTIVLASGATLTVNSNGTFNYDPGTAFLPTPTLGSGASNTPGHDSFTYTLAGGNTVTVSITLTGLDSDDTLLGTAGVDVMFAGIGTDYLDGLAGADQLHGQTGNDNYAVDNAGDLVFEAVGEGTDAVYATVSYQLSAGQEVETLALTDNSATTALNLIGNEFANTLLGNNGANFLDGLGGADIMAGFGGDDTYAIDSASDTVLEDAGAGSDTIYTTLNYQLGTGASIETLAARDNTATTALALVGNELNNTILGNNGANYIDGGAGADIMAGYSGDDTYFVDNAGDQVFEDASRGSDTVFVSFSYTLAAGQSIETLAVTDNSTTTAIDLTGNEINNVILGNNGANVINGGGGADTLIGFGGNDIYHVDNAGDSVWENAGAGNDTVYASASYTLTAGQEIEFLFASNPNGTDPINLTGNELANTIYGNDGANVLDGKGGNDLLVGLDGADTFQFTTALGAGNVDVVFGFTHGVDKIALDDAVFTAIGGVGALNPAAFVVGSAAADASDRIIYNSLTGQLFYDADGNGAGAAIQFATMSPGLTVTASDFTVI